MNIFDALSQLFTRWGINLRYAQLAVNATLIGYAALAVLSVFLSSWGLQWVIWIFLAVYVIGALNILFSPFVWGGLVATAYVRGQVGGQEGLSIEDGFNTVRDWGIRGFDAGAKFLLFYGAVPFIWTALFQTKGWEQENLVALILLPAVIWFALKRFPGSESVRNIIGYTIMAVVVAVIIGTIWSTANRVITDPAMLEMQAYEEQLVKDQKSEEAILARDLRKKVEAKEALSEKELRVWNTMRRLAKEEGIKGRAGKLATEVLDGQATNPSWWKQNWLWIAGGALALFIAYRFFFTTPQVVGGTSPATPRKSGSLWTWVILGLIGWSVYSINQGVGQPGKWWAEMSYDDHPIPVYIANFQPQVVCGLPAERKLRADDLGQWEMENTRNGANRMRAGFWYKEAGTGAFQHASVTLVRVNETLLGQVFQTDARGCVTIDVVVSDADRAGAEILGPPVMRDGQWTYNLKRQPFIAMLRFHRP